MTMTSPNAPRAPLLFKLVTGLVILAIIPQTTALLIHAVHLVRYALTTLDWLGANATNAMTISVYSVAPQSSIVSFVLLSTL